MAQQPAVGMPMKIPIPGQPHPQQRRRPQAFRDHVVRQVQSDEVGPPINGETGANRFPRILYSDTQIHVAGGIERQALARLLGASQMVGREWRRSRAE